MQKRRKRIIAALFGCASLSTFVGCGNTNEDGISKENVSSDQLTDSATEIIKNDNLAVDPQKCIGCGKCSRLAPQNFAMNSDRKAQVISQEITSQASVAKAINVCPTRAISQ